MENGAVTQHSLYWDLFNQNGMDLVTEISFCKITVVDKIRLVFEGWKSAREIILGICIKVYTASNSLS